MGAGVVERGERASYDSSVPQHSRQMLEGPLDRGLVCREWEAELVSFLLSS